MQKKNNIRIMLAISLLQGMVFYASIATLYRQAAGITVFQITLIESISLILSMLLEVPWGILADRIGYRRTMVCCSFLYFISKIIFWQAQGFGGFLAERILLAVTLSGLSGVDESILYASCGKDEVQRVFGRSQALGTAGLMLASVICTLFVGQNYRLAGLLTMIVYGLAAICSLFLSETKPPQHEHPSPFAGFRRSLRLLLHTPALLALILCSSVFGEVIHTVTVFLNQLQYTRCGWGNTLISAAYIASSLAEMSSVWSDGVTRRLGERRTGTALLLISAVCCALLAVTANGWLSLACILLLCFASALYNPLAGAMENRLIIVDDRATTLSVSSLASDSIAMLVNLLLGRAADSSLPLAMMLGSMLCIGALILFTRAAPCKRLS